MLWLRNPVLEDFDQAYENICLYRCLSLPWERQGATHTNQGSCCQPAGAVIEKLSCQAAHSPALVNSINVSGSGGQARTERG